MDRPVYKSEVAFLRAVMPARAFGEPLPGAAPADRDSGSGCDRRTTLKDAWFHVMFYINQYFLLNGIPRSLDSFGACGDVPIEHWPLLKGVLEEYADEIESLYALSSMQDVVSSADREAFMGALFEILPLPPVTATSNHLSPSTPIKP